MNKIISILFLWISLPAFCQDETFIEKFHQSDDLEFTQEKYEFTRENIEAFKDFLNLSFAIMEEKRDLRYVVNSLDSRFEGGLIAPKKFWKPIIDGSITFTYLFREPTENKRGLYGFYASRFKKVNDSEVWNINRVLLLPGIVVSSRFEKQDFNDLHLTFKQRFLLKAMPKNEWLNYSSRQYENLDDPQTLTKIEKGCYAIYRYERMENNVQLQVDFCEPKAYFQESHQHPAEFERVFTRRIFEEKGLLQRFSENPKNVIVFSAIFLLFLLLFLKR